VLDQRQALARQLAQRLSEGISVQVVWQLVAQSGLTTAQIGPLLQDQPQGQGPTVADLAVVVTGVNDVIEQIPSHRAVAAREALANQLRNGMGVQHVVFAPLPPVHHFPGLPQPLRWVAGADAKRHNAALRRWCASRADVSCVDMEMPLNRGVMARDGFHPGEPVYRYCAGAIAQHITRQVWPLMARHSGT
jgi:lysophospholipase L1-like esterase